MDKYEELKQAYAAVEKLLNARRFRAAYKLAQNTLSQFRSYTQARFMLALTANLMNRHQEALIAHGYASRNCIDFNDFWNGNFERDHALWAIRSRKFRLAEQHLARARELHAHDDANYTTCLIAVEARLRYAQRRYDDAAQLHSHADNIWRHLGERANQQWVFNNRFHWLKTLVMLGNEYGDPEMNEVLYPLLVQNDDYGSKQHYLRMLFIPRGWADNKLDDLIQRLVHMLHALR